MSSPPSNRPSGVSDRGTDLPLESEAGWSIQGGPGTAVDYPSGQGSDADPVRLRKTVSDNDGSRIDAGSLFQTRGPLTANEWSPNVVLVGGTSSFIMSDDYLRPARRWRIQRQSSAK